ncbi:MAG: hypothetical protein WDZ41_05760 [Candidatus Babeliales bacterium]
MLLKVKYSLFLLLVIAIVFNQLQAMVEFSLLENKESKQKILLIGCFLREDIEKKLVEKNKLIMKVLNNKSLETKKMIQCIYDYDTLKTEPKYIDNSLTNNYLHYQFSKDISKNPYLKLEFYHQKVFEWTVINEHRQCLIEVFSKLDPDAIKNFKKFPEPLHLYQAMRDFYELNEYKDMSLAEYFEAMKAQVKKSKEIRDHYNNLQQIKIVSLLDSRIKKINESRNKIYELFDKYNERMSLLLVFLNHLQQSDTIDEILQEIDRIHKIMLHGFAFNTGVVHYLHGLLKLPREKTIFVLGISYAQDIANVLQNLNHTMIKQTTVLKTDSSSSFSSVNVNWDNEHEKSIFTILNEFMD